jgi:hypothetical protein
VSLVWGTSLAAFTSSAQNGSDSFALGSVTLTDNDQGSVFFSATGIKPGAAGTSCVTVTYSGSLNATGVRLYATGLTGTGLGAYVTLTVEEGSGTGATGGASLSCTGYSVSSTLYSGTLASFAATKTDYASGLSTWAPTSAGGSRSYRVTYTLQNNTSAQGLTCGVTLTWQARG